MAHLNSNKRLKLCQLLNDLVFFKILETRYQKFHIPLSVLRKAYRPTGHFLFLSQFYKGHEKGQKKTSAFSDFDHTTLQNAY